MGKVIELLAHLAGDNDEFVKAMKEAGKSLDGFMDGVAETAKAVQGMATKIAGVATGVGLAIGGGLAVAATGASEFESKFAEVLSLLDAPPPEIIDQLKTGAREVAETFGQDVVNATDAMYQAISAGIPAGEAVEFIGSAATAAVGGVTDLKTAVDLGTNVLNAYGKSADQLNDVLDSTFIAVKLGKTTFEEMGGAIGRVAPLASNLGISVDELNASLATITLSGIKTDEAVTGLKAALSNILKPTEQSAEMAKRLGVQFDNAAVKTKGLKGVLDEVAAAARANGIELLDAFSALFGSTEAANAVLALYAQNGEKLTMVLDAMANKSGAAAKAFETIKDNDPTFVFKQLSESAQGLSDRIGSAVLTMVGPFVVGLLDIVTNLNAWIDANPALATTIATVGAAIAALSLALGAAAAVLAVVAGLVAAISTIGLPALAAGVLVILPFLALFAGAAALIVANWDAIKKWVDENWPAIKQTFMDNIGPIVDSLRDAGAAIREQLQGMGEKFLKWLTANMPTIRATLASAMKWLAETAIPAVRKALEKIFNGIQWFAKYIDTTWPTVWANFKAGWEAIKEAVGLVVDILKSIVAPLRETVGLFGSKEPKTFAEHMKDVNQGLGTFIEFVRLSIKDIRELYGWMKKLSPLLLAFDLFNKNLDNVKKEFEKLNGGSGGGGGKTPKKFARGGIVNRPTFALAGEAGPEAFVPLDSGAIPVRLEGIGGTMDSGGGGTNTFNMTIVQRDGESGESLAQRVADAVLRRRG